MAVEGKGSKGGLGASGTRGRGAIGRGDMGGGGDGDVNGGVESGSGGGMQKMGGEGESGEERREQGGGETLRREAGEEQQGGEQGRGKRSHMAVGGWEGDQGERGLGGNEGKGRDTSAGAGVRRRVLEWTAGGRGGEEGETRREEEKRRRWEELEDLAERVVVGGEVCAWSERIDPSQLMATVWPRAAAMAVFRWMTGEVHSVYMMEDPVKFATCNVKGTKELFRPSGAGHVLWIPQPTDLGKTFYFVSKGKDCLNGIKATLKIT
ncbi:unnamed protein product [Closterium sp. NIES-53]